MIFFLVIKASLGCPKVVGRLLKKIRERNRRKENNCKKKNFKLNLFLTICKF